MVNPFATKIVKELPEEKLWDAYKNNGDEGAREELILKYLAYARRIGERTKAIAPEHIEKEDLVSWAIFGLIDAVEKYNPSRGVKFTTYASSRIKGAVIDGLRSMDWVPRSVRDRAAEFRTVILELEKKLGRPPDDSEIAKEMKLTQEQYWTFVDKMRRMSILSLEQMVSKGEDQLRIGDMIADEKGKGPDSVVERSDLKNRLVMGLEKLPEREKLLLSLYYIEELTLKEIGQILEISESRVCQIHTIATARLRTYIEEGI